MTQYYVNCHDLLLRCRSESQKWNEMALDTSLRPKHARIVSDNLHGQTSDSSSKEKAINSGFEQVPAEEPLCQRQHMRKGRTKNKSP